LDNMTNDEKKMLPRDEYGNPVLLAKPTLERSYNNIHIKHFVNEDIYKLMTSIKSNMKNIVQFENQYLQSSDMNDTNNSNIASFIRN